MTDTRNKTPHHATASAAHLESFTLFPPIAPYSTGFLSAGPVHQIYWEQCGNPEGVPIVLFHGGPGAGASAIHRRYFNPEHYRIIIFDQRGAGRSTPLGCLEDNSPTHLIDDIEALRAHLQIERWHIFGGSWGSTLALAYAQEHPSRCISMILRGIFLMEETEIEWFMYGMRNIFPEAWDQFAAVIPAEKHKNLLEEYYSILTGEDKQAAQDAAIAWSLYEGACAKLLPNYETITTDEQKAFALSIGKIEAHYFTHHAFTKENSLLNHIDKIRHIPATIIQGRYDIICPIITANKLHAAWPEADYIVVPDGGHASSDPTIRARLIEATENMRNIT